jgi:hypothetical protein
LDGNKKYINKNTKITMAAVDVAPGNKTFVATPPPSNSVILRGSTLTLILTASKP